MLKNRNCAKICEAKIRKQSDLIFVCGFNKVSTKSAIKIQGNHHPDGRAQSLLTMNQAIADHIRLAPDHTGGGGGEVEGKGGAAELLEMNPSTLRFRMKKLGIRSKGT